MTAYYNEFDPKAAAVLRELIKAGLIAPGDVDERSIEDVVPAELVGYTQCHFFAGFGVWSYALRRAGWPDDRSIWSASCPCQPFSQAGEGAGFSDERHLWPHLYHLIDQCRPGIVIGEQVASKDANPWVDLVQTDLEAVAYAFGAAAFPSAGVGAPHIRDRTYWVANAGSQGPQEQLRRRVESSGSATGNSSGLMGDSISEGLAQCVGLGRIFGGAGGANAGQAIKRTGIHPDGLGNAHGTERATCDFLASSAGQGSEGRVDALLDGGNSGRPGPVNGLWRDADWLLCRDGKWRPVEPGTFPLAHGSPARVGRLRGYGNAINAEAAKAFIEAVMETTP